MVARSSASNRLAPYLIGVCIGSSWLAVLGVSLDLVAFGAVTSGVLMVGLWAWVRR